jgi:hypothetical protein
MARLEQRIQRRGITRADYLRSLLERDLSDQPPEVSLEDLLEPFRRGFAQSDMTEGELLSLLDTELNTVRAERRERQAGSHGEAQAGRSA